MRRIDNNKKSKRRVLKVAAIGAATYLTKELLDDIKPHIKEMVYTSISKSIEASAVSPSGIAIATYLHSMDIPYLNSMIHYNEESGRAIFDRRGKCVFYRKGCIHIVSVYEKTSEKVTSNKCRIDIIGKNSSKVKEEILEFRKILNRSKIAIRKYNGSSSSVSTNIEAVSFDSVLSHANSNIMSILDKFESDSEYYDRLKLPHKTGILLYGEPGTGKTTMAKVIASYLNYDLLIVNASNIDAGFLEMNKNKNVILFEDIDCEIDNRENGSRIKTKDNKSIPITDLLNILDGANSPGDCIFVATTNYYDRLDPAIKRSGRFDHHIELGKLDHDLAVKMCHKFEVNPDEVLQGVQIPINPSDLQRHILEYRRLHM